MLASNHALKSLYERVRFSSRDGYEIDINSDYWRLSKDIAFKLDSLPDFLSLDIKKAFRQVLSVYAETSSAQYTMSLFRRFRFYCESTAELPLLSPESMISHRSSMGDDDWQLSSLRAFLRTWISLGYEGVPANTMKLMEGWTIKGNEKGYAVQSMCPESGPFTDIEMGGLVSKIIDFYASGKLDPTDTSYAMILAMTGRRPAQICALKLKDLVPRGDRYFINFPRGKQKHGEWRGSFKEYEIVEDLWDLLQGQAASVKYAFEEVLEYPVPQSLVGELPLFANLKRHDSTASLKAQLEGDFLHAPTGQVSYALKKVQDAIGLISERTQALINITAYRFRYTLGTNLAREGKGEYVIAEALDHSDTQNSGVYVRNIPEIVERIDKAVALQLAPLAQAFQGVLVLDETKARRGGDRSSRICSAGGNVGSCGSYGFCGALAPIACYTCSNFQPWLDGPHEEVLDQLIAERDSVLANTGDLKIASVNDRLILAVSDVCARCKAMKSDVADE